MVSSKNKKVLTCSVITIDGFILKVMQVDHVEIPTYDGYISIHKDHCSYIVSVSYGELRVYTSYDEFISLYIEGGITEVENNVISILVEKALYPKDINVDFINKQINELSNQTVINVEEAKRNSVNIDKLKKQIEISLK